MKMVRYLLAFLVGLALHFGCQAQTDTIPAPAKGKPHRHKYNIYKVDSVTLAVHSPHKASLYSTVFPGLGQIYNRKYWKVPIVWAAVGIPVYTYFYNKNWYQKCQFAISVVDNYPPGTTVPADTLAMVDPKLQGFVTSGDDNNLRTYRNEFRKDQDYSILFFLLFWGLNIVDATVDAHLMSFDVSNKLTFHLQPPATPATLPGPMGTGMGLSLVVDFHKPKRIIRKFPP
ncbi:MAG TPA: DUF5683 domain-containing protein [Puia sp.]|jgi:hypothetical protein|nr:DUF5683 domain-containing protein [Puia sp.]